MCAMRNGAQLSPLLVRRCCCCCIRMYMSMLAQAMLESSLYRRNSHTVFFFSLEELRSLSFSPLTLYAAPLAAALLQLLYYAFSRVQVHPRHKFKKSLKKKTSKRNSTRVALLPLQEMDHLSILTQLEQEGGLLLADAWIAKGKRLKSFQHLQLC